MGKATVYLDDDVDRALRMKSAEINVTMSQLVNDSIRIVMAEDLEDISDWNDRRGERTIGYEEFLRQLRADGTIGNSFPAVGPKGPSGNPEITGQANSCSY